MTTLSASPWKLLKEAVTSFRYRAPSQSINKDIFRQEHLDLTLTYLNTMNRQAYNVDSDHAQGPSHRLPHGHDELKDRPWNSGAKARFPLLSLTCLLLIIALSFGTVVVLLISDGKDVNSWCATTVKVADQHRKWRFSVNAWIALFSFLSLKAATVMCAEAVAISWWIGALRGQSLKNLHFRWEVSESLFAIILQRRTWSWICVASFAFTALTGLEALLQTASTSKTVLSTNNVNMTAGLANALPAGFSGVIAATGHDTFGVVYLTPVFIEILRNYTIQSPIHLDLSGCDSTSNVSCATTLNGVEFHYTCNASRSRLQTPLSAVDDDTAQEPVNTVFAVGFQEGDWSISMNALWHDKAGSEGLVVANHNCTMIPAQVEYPVSVTESTVTLQPPSSLVEWTADSVETKDNLFMDKVVTVLPKLDYDRHVSGGFVDEATPSMHSTLGGIVLAFSNLFASRITLKSDITNVGADISVTGSFAAPYAQFSKGTIDSLHVLDNTFSSPMQELLTDMRDIIFRSSVAIAANRITDYIRNDTQSTNWAGKPIGQAQSSHVPAEDTTRVGEYRIYHTVYETNRVILGIGIGLIFAALLAITPLYWGFWRLGRKVSLSPLEVAKALHTPSISDRETDLDVAQTYGVLNVDADAKGHQRPFGDPPRRTQDGSNLTADELVEMLGMKKVRYGEVGPNILGMGFMERTLAPRKGWIYR